MSLPLNHLNKIDSYMHAERQSQFSDAKREDILLEKLAKIKEGNVVNCEWCKKRMIAKDIHKLHLCDGCNGGHSTISYYLRNHKKSHLTDEDRQIIANGKNIRRGPFFNPKTS